MHRTFVHGKITTQHYMKTCITMTTSVGGTSKLLPPFFPVPVSLIIIDHACGPPWTDYRNNEYNWARPLMKWLILKNCFFVKYLRNLNNNTFFRQRTVVTIHTARRSGTREDTNAVASEHKWKSFWASPFYEVQFYFRNYWTAELL